MEKYTTQDLRKMLLEDDTTAQIIRWLEDDHKPSQAELALASTAIKYFWLLRRQLIVLSGVVYYQRVEQQTGCAGNRGGGVLLQNHCRESYWSWTHGDERDKPRVKRYAISYGIRFWIVVWYM